MSNPKPVKQFQPGQSGNPSGLSKEQQQEGRRRLKALTNKAIKVLEEILENDGASAQTRFITAKFVIERTMPIEGEAVVETQEDPIEKLARVLVRKRDDKPPEMTNQLIQSENPELAEFQAIADASGKKEE